MEKIIALIFAIIFICIVVVLIQCVWYMVRTTSEDLQRNDRRGFFIIIDLLELGCGYYSAYFVGYLTWFLYESTAGIFRYFWNV
jgi:hypothetical protein